MKDKGGLRMFKANNLLTLKAMYLGRSITGAEKLTLT
jgi:hypothetical protein